MSFKILGKHTAIIYLVGVPDDTELQNYPTLKRRVQPKKKSPT